MVDADIAQQYRSDMLRLTSIIKLIRPVNCIMAGIAVWVGAYLTEGYAFNVDIVLAAVAAACVAAAANIQNDILDIQTDLIVHPDRVLASGQMPVSTAAILAAVILGIGLLLAAIVGPATAIAACAATALLAVYNAYLKKIVLVGNVAIGLAGGLPFIVGGLAAGTGHTFDLPGPIIPAVFAVSFHIVREIIKDIQDIDGDRTADVVTLPQAVGTRGAVGIALLLFLLFDFQVIGPIYKGWFGMSYTILSIAGVVVPLTASLAVAAANPTPLRLRWCATGLKIGMGIGMLALVIGRQS